MTNNVRRLALETLIKIEKGAYSSLELNHIIRDEKMDHRDAGLLTQIVYGVIQNRLLLNYQLTPFLKKKVEPWVVTLLETALYQMQFLDRIPNRAIFNETINIAKQKGHDGIRKMVTGVLHNIDRNGVRDPKTIKDSLERLSIQFSIPKWLIKKLNQELGIDKTESILKSINQPAKQSVRVNLKKITKDQLIAKLTQEGYHVAESNLVGEGLILSGLPANHSKCFKDGLMTIQDESAMLPVESMPITSNQYILDACSAPGGKTTQIAEHLSGNGKVLALDLHAKRLKQVAENAYRMGVAEYVDATALDARKVTEKFNDDTFDQILVDAPCSGIGLIRRKPEIRYEKQPTDIDHLHRIQLSILNSLTNVLKVGGQLTYSTCTILNEENQSVIQEFLEQNPNFTIKPVKTSKIKMNNGEPLLKIYPDDFESDGFFVSNLIKERD